MGFLIWMLHIFNITFAILFLVNLARLPRRSNPDR